MAKLSNEAYQRFLIYLGEDKADEVAEDVESGDMDKGAAEEWSIQIEEMRENSRGRRDIEPEEWQDFEEGWRPDGWY
jgi:hypothetical protein